MLQRRLRSVDEGQIGFHLAHQRPHLPDVVAQRLGIVCAGIPELTDLRIFRGAGGASLQLEA